MKTVCESVFVTSLFVMLIFLAVAQQYGSNSIAEFWGVFSNVLFKEWPAAFTTKRNSSEMFYPLIRPQSNDFIQKNVTCWQPMLLTIEPQGDDFFERHWKYWSQAATADLNVTVCTGIKDYVVSVNIVNKTCLHLSQKYQDGPHATQVLNESITHPYDFGREKLSHALGIGTTDLPFQEERRLFTLTGHGPFSFRVRLSGTAMLVLRGGQKNRDEICEYYYESDIALTGLYYLEVVLLYNNYNGIRDNVLLRPMIGSWVLWTSVDLVGRYQNRQQFQNALRAKYSSGILPACSKVVIANPQLEPDTYRGLWVMNTKTSIADLESSNTTNKLWMLLRSTVIRTNINNNTTFFGAPWINDLNLSGRTVSLARYDFGRVARTFDSISAGDVDFIPSNCYQPPWQNFKTAVVRKLHRLQISFTGDSQIRTTFNHFAHLVGANNSMACTRAHHQCALVTIANRSLFFTEPSTGNTRPYYSPGNAVFVWNPKFDNEHRSQTIQPLLSDQCVVSSKQAKVAGTIASCLDRATKGTPRDMKIVSECSSTGPDWTFFNLGQHFTVKASPSANTLYVQRMKEQLTCYATLSHQNMNRSPIQRFVWINTYPFPSTFQTDDASFKSNKTDHRCSPRHAVQNALAQEILALNIWKGLLVFDATPILEAVSDLSSDGSHFPYMVMRPVVQMIAAILVDWTE